MTRLVVVCAINMRWNCSLCNLFRHLGSGLSPVVLLSPHVGGFNPVLR